MKIIAASKNPIKIAAVRSGFAQLFPEFSPFTNTIYLPPRVAELVAGGMELGEADDMVFGTHNSKQSNGAVGILMHDVLKREEGFMIGVVGALVPHRNPELYQDVVDTGSSERS